MKEIITFRDLAKKLNVNSSASLMHKFVSASKLHAKGIIHIDLLTLVHQSKILNKGIYRDKLAKTNYIYAKDEKIVLSTLNYIKNIQSKYKKNNNKKQIIWSEDSIYCYNIGCNCKNCKIAEMFPVLSYECKLKKSVIELVRIYGKP